MKPETSQSFPLRDLEEGVGDAFSEVGLDPAAAESLATLALLVIISALKGQQVYIPQSLFNTYRDREIYREARGHNTGQIALDHGLHERTVRKIVRRYRLQKRRG